MILNSTPGTDRCHCCVRKLPIAEPFAKFGIEHLHKTTEERTCPASHLSPGFSWEGCRCQVNGVNGSTTKSTKGTKSGPSLAQSRFCAFCGRSTENRVLEILIPE